MSMRAWAPIELRTADGLGLILAATATSSVTLPSADNSSMDGYALVADDLMAATRAQPVRLAVIGEMVAGSSETLTVARGTCVRIMTGAPIPPGADAVVPVELTLARDELATLGATEREGDLDAAAVGELADLHAPRNAELSLLLAGRRCSIHRFTSSGLTHRLPSGPTRHCRPSVHWRFRRRECTASGVSPLSWQ